MNLLCLRLIERLNIKFVLLFVIFCYQRTSKIVCLQSFSNAIQMVFIQNFVRSKTIDLIQNMSIIKFKYLAKNKVQKKTIIVSYMGVSTYRKPDDHNIGKWRMICQPLI